VFTINSSTPTLRWNLKKHTIHTYVIFGWSAAILDSQIWKFWTPKPKSLIVMQFLFFFPIFLRHLGPDFNLWSQIGGAAQMCSYLSQTWNFAPLPWQSIQQGATVAGQLEIGLLDTILEGTRHTWLTIETLFLKK
jgi:hypothetical protein